MPSQRNSAQRQRCVPVVQTYRNVRTGEITSFTTRIHKPNGGVVTTRRSRHLRLRDMERIVMQQYRHSEVVFVPETMEFRHQFQLHSTRQQMEQPSTVQGSPLGEIHLLADAPDHPRMAEEPSDGAINELPVVARGSRVNTPKRYVRQKKRQPRLSDPQLLIIALTTFLPRLGALSTESTANPHIRVRHFFQNNRTFAFGTAYITSERGPKALLTVLWQYQISPRKAVCITFSLPIMGQETGTSSEINPNESSDQYGLVANCTCCHLISQRRGSEAGCFHAQVCLAWDDFASYVSSEIRRRQNVANLNEESDTIFGKCIDVERLGELWYFLTVFLERPSQSGRRLVRPWMFFIVLDVNMQIFVPVMKQFGKPFQCMICRGSADRRLSCDHEDVCHRACIKVKEDPRGHGLLSELAILDENGSSDSESDDDGGNQSIRIPGVYHPTSFKRNIMPCIGEQNYMTILARRIENIPFGEFLDFDDRLKACCPTCGLENTKPRYDGYRRTVNLFTMGQGVVRAYVYDWFCHTCQQTRRFTGRSTAIFPARKESCYTTEMMYTLLDMTCMQGLSFRAAYRAVCLFGRLPSTLERIKNIIPELQVEEEKKSRRRASEAFGFFLNHIDTSSPLITKKLFSCDNCEYSIPSHEYEELRLSEQEGRDTKRFRAIVIDGTAAGILTKLPSYEKEMVKMPAAKKGLGAVYLLRNAGHRKIVDKLVEMVRQSLREWRKKSSSARGVSNVFETGYMQFWLTKPTKTDLKQDGIIATKLHMKDLEIQILRLYMDEDSCFCLNLPDGRSDRVQSGLPAATRNEEPPVAQNELPPDTQHAESDINPHEASCEDVRKSFEKERGASEIGGVIRELFTITERLSSSQRNPPPSSNNSRSQPSGTPSTQDLDDMRALGAILDDDDDESEDEEESEQDEDEDSGDMSGNTGQRSTSKPSMHASLRLAHLKQSAKFAEAVMDLFHFLLGEHVALPFVSRISASSHVATEAASPSMLSFTSVHIHLHEDLIKAVDEYCSCMHYQEAGRTRIVPPACACHEKLKQSTVAINEANPIFSTFCQELLKLRRPLHVTQSCTVNALLELTRKHIQLARSYFPVLERRLSAQSQMYWHNHSRINSSSGYHQTNQTEETALDTSRQGQQASGEQDMERHNARFGELELEQSLSSGICFPGRLSSRPSITFNMKDQQNCTKKYNVARSHSPGLLTVQCTCDAPKLIGFLVMTKAESVSQALSAILTNLDIPPKMVYYDNACNLFVSTLLRVPWLLGQTRLAVDRFHYKSHKCCSFFNPDSYRHLDMHRTETAESINSRIETSLGSIRYMKGKKLVPYLRARFSLMNLVATYKQKYLRADLEDEDLTAFFNEIHKCDCHGCKEQKAMMEEKATQEENITQMGAHTSTESTDQPS